MSESRRSWERAAPLDTHQQTDRHTPSCRVCCVFLRRVSVKGLEIRKSRGRRAAVISRSFTRKHTVAGESEGQNGIRHTHTHTQTHTEAVCVGPGFCSAEQAAAQQSPYGPVLESEHAEMEGWREKRMWRKWRDRERERWWLFTGEGTEKGRDWCKDGRREGAIQGEMEGKEERKVGGKRGRMDERKEGRDQRDGDWDTKRKIQHGLMQRRMEGREKGRRDDGRKWREMVTVYRWWENGRTDLKKYGGMRGKREGRKDDREEMERDWEKGKEKERKIQQGPVQRRIKDGNYLRKGGRR